MSILLAEERDGSLLLTLNRPDSMNAMSMELADMLLVRPEKAADRIKVTSPLGCAAVKRMVNLGTDLPVEAASDLNDALRRPLEATQDYEEGIRAHFEKRKPVFRGE